MLVVAGPGAGKTFCLIGRIRHLIVALGFDARRICAVTFTNKAAGEIAERLRREIGDAASGISTGTLHGLCLSLLRDHADACGLRRGFGVADDDYQRQLLRRLGAPPIRHAQLLRVFGSHRLRNVPLSADDAVLFGRYRDALRGRNLVDYDDLIALAGTLLRADHAGGGDIRGRWDCLLVDEFQDLSLGQYSVVAQLADGHRHCFAVGDDEQSIFSWAGADPSILERFRTDFRITAPVVLDHNRRCSRQIFEAARRLVTRNPALFDKQLAADRESEHEVAAWRFADEREEAEWIVDDLGRDHARSSLGWGDYALLYRYHRVGQQLETRLVEAGIPCRTARGQALGEDDLIAYVVASLRVIRSPDDPIVADAFVELVLPKSLLFQVRTATSAPTLVDGLRAFAKAARRGDVDARRAWRVVYHLENLGALGRGHDSLARLVDELLAQRLGPFRSPLEERADELTDPLSLPAAVALAGRLGEAAGSGHTIWIEPDGGLEIALIRLIEGGAGGDVRRLPPDARVRPGDFILRAGSVRALTVFKALQLLHADGAADPFQDYVAFDLETTDLDVSGCDVVEIAAVRIRGRVVVDRFESRVRPTRPLHPEASAVHGWYDQDLCDQPLFADVWPEFRAFVGKDVLVAHNGQRFDIPVLRRLAAGLPGADDLAFFDTLPLARSLVDGSARLADLADRFGVSAGRSHHALDDAVTLAGVLAHLGDLKLARARKGALVHLIGWLGLALALVPAEGLSPEERLLRDLALPATLGRFSDCLEIYAAESPAAVAPAVEEIVERLGGARLMERIRTDRPVAERYPASVARLSALVDGSAATTLDDSIDTLLDRVALSKSDGVPSDPGRVSLLTLHSTKGLEFSRVYVVGVEDGQLPGLRELDDDRIEEIRESRRLLYVGMTRAKDRLVLTSVERREGRGTGGALFLREAGLEAGPAPVLDESAAPLAVSEVASA